MRRAVARLALAALLGGFGCSSAWAHAGPRQTDPVDGATLGESPAAIRLSFSERPEPALSVVRVLDASGAACQTGAAEYAPDDPLSLTVPIRRLDRGVYLVTWRIVSAVDGHATTGAYAFGVREAPTAATSTAPVDAAISTFEMLARWLLLVGLTALLGSAAAGVAAFGGHRAFVCAAAGWLLAIIGAVLLAEAQRRNAAASFAALLNTSIGRALLWRVMAIASAGAALVFARSEQLRTRRGGWCAVALAVMTAIAAHLAAGHAAAGGAWPRSANFALQWVHFVAVGIWFGGLAALLVGIAGAASAEKAESVRRFSGVAAVSLLAVATTGAARALGELSSWADLVGTTYGRTIAIKAALIAIIASLGAFNRWRAVPVARVTLRPLRRAASGELALAAVALAATAALGASPPPASLKAPVGLDATGIDLGTTVRVHLTTPSDQPGPNRFVIDAVDYDSRAPIAIRRMTLSFVPLDDVGVAPTSLALTPVSASAFVGAGANLAFDGRWRITALIERAGDSVEVPMDVETRSRPQFLSTLRVPGKAPEYTIEVRGKGRVRVSLHPEKVGRSELRVTCFDGIYEDLPIESLVLTTTTGTSDRTRQLSARRLDRSRFAADIDLARGSNRIAVIARTADGNRLRTTLDVPVQ